MISAIEIKNNYWRRIALIGWTAVAIVLIPVLITGIFINNLIIAIIETNTDVQTIFDGLGSDWLKAWRGRA